MSHTKLALPSFPTRFLVAIRPISLTATFAPWLITVSFLKLNKFDLHWSLSLVSAALAILLQMSVNILNDVADFEKGIDRPGGFGGSGVLQKKWFEPSELNYIAWSIAAFCLGCGLLIIPYNIAIIVILFIAIILALAYSFQGGGLKYIGLGDLVVFITCGPALTFAFAFVALQRIELISLIPGIFTGLLSIGILHANNFHDFDDDRKAGAMTFSHVLGFNNSKWYMLIVYLMGFVTLVYMREINVIGRYALVVPGLALILIIQLLRKMFRAANCHDTHLQAIRFDAAKIHLLMSLLFVVGLILDYYFV